VQDFGAFCRVPRADEPTVSYRGCRCTGFRQLGEHSAPWFRSWVLVVIAALVAVSGVGWPAPVAALDRTDCFQCHDGTEGPTVDEKLFDQTVHADVDCTECHGDVAYVPHDAPLKKVDCSQCHDEVTAV
jgi:hypothetical protein